MWLLILTFVGCYAWGYYSGKDEARWRRRQKRQRRRLRRLAGEGE